MTSLNMTSFLRCIFKELSQCLYTFGMFLDSESNRCPFLCRYGFRRPPHLELKARPKLGEREVTFAHVTDWIEKKLDQEFQVLPGPMHFTFLGVAILSIHSLLCLPYWVTGNLEVKGRILPGPVYRRAQLHTHTHTPIHTLRAI